MEKERKVITVQIDEEFYDSLMANGGNGGSTEELKRNDVNFFDYDGTLLYAYSWEEAKELTELPALPKHEGLEVREWNYTLEDVKAQGTETTIGKVDIGACVYDSNGEQVLGLGVEILERGVIRIESRSISGCYGVCSIPNTVTFIDSEAFYRFTHLHVLKFPISVEDVIDYYSAFNYSFILNTWWNGTNRTLDYRCEYGVRLDIQEGVSEVDFSSNHEIMHTKYPTTIYLIQNLVNNGRCPLLHDFSKLNHVPTLESAYIDSRPSIIAVPNNLYDDWINETNWSDAKHYIYTVSELPWLNNL